jgi:hypothetical protein
MVSYFKGCLRLVAVTFQITFLFYFLKFIFDITVYQNNPKIQKKNYFEAKKKTNSNFDEIQVETHSQTPP